MKDKGKHEYIGLQFVPKEAKIMEHLQRADPSTANPVLRLKQWVGIETLLNSYRSYKTIIDDEAV